MNRQIASMLALIFAVNGFSQIGINTVAPAASAAVEVYSDSKGIMLPVVSDGQMKAISSPATGLAVYNATQNTYYYYNGTIWAKIGTKGIKLQDSDADTKVQVEKTANDNQIRMDIGNNSGAPAIDYIRINSTGVNTGNYTLPANKTLHIGSNIVMPATKGNNGTVLSTNGAGSWYWAEPHGGLGVSAGVQTMYLAEARAASIIGSNSYYTPIIPFASMSVDTLEIYIAALAGSPSLKCAIYNAAGDTLATSEAYMPAATGLFKMRLRGAGYHSAGYAGPMLNAASLYYFAITCLNNSNTEVRSCVSSTNPFTISSTTDLLQPMGATSSTSTSVWMSAY